MSTPVLFTPTVVGRMHLVAHRVVLAPMTRLRNDPQTFVPLPLVKEYYAQRAEVPGTLLISEGMVIHEKAGGYPAVASIYTDAQVAGWKEVVDAVHAKGSFIYAQIAGIGRQAQADFVPNRDVVGPSAIPSTEEGAPIPRPLSISEIKEYVQWFVTASENAVLKAGFDGVEIHAANGYLLNEFIEDVSNDRTDEYGGSIENRARFVLETVDAISAVIGADRVGVRFSPWNRELGCGMADPVPTYTYLIKELARRHPNLAYIHAIEPRFQNSDEESDTAARVLSAHESNDFLREAWGTKPFIAAGGFTRESGIAQAAEKGDLIAYGRYYTSNADLPKRLERHSGLIKYDRSQFYAPGGTARDGYVDFVEVAA
ncbi:FMN-linked oxidoreductase [Cylindrobasidium torrendii FP15055 ss-10]|uniref:FMN-linked oxidoreductase n=1 Tax=Cylindrobasidium torrendii FP15055 ss-10 TaxID=1314674 RepID=A0A0D7BUY9_9AGAR|nr:FMN-linked oxidoreductase [Cylindrobasidium torrendii FP15055 ss-10]